MAKRSSSIEKVKLTPPDRNRCQVEWSVGRSFMRLGPVSPVRCTSKPDYIVKEKQKGPDGQQGSMSMCEEHKKVYDKQNPGKGFSTRI